MTAEKIPVPPAQKRRSSAPAPSSADAQRRMKATRTRDTKAEVLVRSALHQMGFRFRVDVRPEPSIRRRADLVFRRAKVAVFIDGCFWHGCPDHATWPKANADFWRTKILTNQGRDIDTNQRLADRGWLVVRIWEHENPVEAASRVARILRERC
jgi:DNA mismatch endonuclease, patch repair protein